MTRVARTIRKALCAAVAATAVLLVSTSAVEAQVPFWKRPTPTKVAPSPTPIPPGSVRVEVVLLRGKKRLPGEDSVVWMPGLRAPARAKDYVKVAQNKKQFEPRLAIVSVGSTVDFPNYDRVFHNVFSVSTARSFDLGLYRKGKSKAVRFDQPGLVQVYCNIHPHMAAYVMVVDSPIHGVADDQGRITLRDIPAGRRTIEGWNVRGGFWSREVMIRAGRMTAVTVDLDISSWRQASHLNKHGKEYPPPDDDDFRY
jgi:plastocyanin